LLPVYAGRSQLNVPACHRKLHPNSPAAPVPDASPTTSPLLLIAVASLTETPGAVIGVTEKLVELASPGSLVAGTVPWLTGTAAALVPSEDAAEASCVAPPAAVHVPATKSDAAIATPTRTKPLILPRSLI